MTITNLFSGSGDRRVLRRLQMQKLNPRTLEEINGFVAHLALPEPEHRIYTEIRDFVRVSGKSRAPYCLLLLADREDISYLNAGYAAGQALAYLRFQGFCACILREVPSSCQGEDGRSCVGIIAFGKDALAASPGKGESASDTVTCVCRDLRGHWTEEVLALAKKRFPFSSGNVRIIREDNRMYFSPRYQTGKRKKHAEFETGTAVANAMAAAEELWVDLALERSGDARRTICLTPAR